MTLRKQIEALERLAESSERLLAYLPPELDATEILEHLESLQGLHAGLDRLETALVRISEIAKEGIEWQDEKRI